MLDIISIALLYSGPVLAVYLAMTLGTQDRIMRIIVTTIAALVSLGALFLPHAVRGVIDLMNAHPRAAFITIEIAAAFVVGAVATAALFVVVFVFNNEMDPPNMSRKVFLLVLTGAAITLAATHDARKEDLACIERTQSYTACLS